MARTDNHRAFLSHSWRDKALARRIARRLSHRGVSVWIDEAEMQVGDRLSERLATEISRSSYFLVLLTNAARTSKWVAQEIEVAKSSRIPIVPLVAEDGVNMTPVDESLGVSITDPWTFEDRLNTVAGAILGHSPPDERDPDLLRRDLRTLQTETPELRGLIEQLMDEGRITHAQSEAMTVSEELRYPAETALIALHECADADVRYVISLEAAKYFRQLGVGYEVLRRQIVQEGGESDHLRVMFTHLGDYIARPSDIEGAFRLFEMSKPPQDQAFSRFVDANFDKLTLAQRDRAVRFITTPDRGPAGFAVDAAFSLFSRLPDSKPLHHLWWFWVNDYKFGGRPDVDSAQHAHVFFNLMNEAAKRELTQFGPIMEHFETRFRHLARGSDLADILEAVSLLMTASQSHYVRRKGLAAQLQNAVGSAEWDDVEHGDILASPILRFGSDIAEDRDYSDSLRALNKALLTISEGRHIAPPIG